ncbi:hypothetical protein CgunFtcFv8_027503 [Champsocephalus gunnari]|uniref:Zona pellucida sperm-binding protein 3 n=1 Tax=Champsocephalus gunnari TaxID=52237 RepID=A0AAN8DXX6_CHAGU|nr:hypothetical protein CgunFtcFv8_027503 [Champsocephalus gunnari]
MFAVGAPVDGDEIRLGVETDNQYCRATASSADEYSISVGLVECGTRRWVTEDSLIYTNLLIYSPEASPYGVVRMEEAVIPLECRYERKYSVSSSSLAPTWIPFVSTQAAVEMLQFNLRIMTGDWQHTRGSMCFISVSPSASRPRPGHAFIGNGCFVDSQLPGSRSQFLARTQDDKLHMSIDAFRFYNEDRGELYITCRLYAVPINSTDATTKACTFVNGRWQSADGNDYLCGQCKRPIGGEQTPSSPSKFRPRGFVKPEEREALWRSGLKTGTVWGHQARVGPMMVLPAKQKSRPIPAEEPSSIRDQVSRSTTYGSQWRSGTNRVDQRKGLLPDSSSTQHQVDVVTLASEQNKDEEDKSGTEKDADAEDVPGPLERPSPEARLQPKAAVLNGTNTAALDEVLPAAAVHVAVPPPLSSATATEPDLPEAKDSKR